MDIRNILYLAGLRFLHHLNLDRTSSSFGVADREWWAWKTKDFPNGTLQAGIAGLLDSKDLLPLSDEQICELVFAAVRGTRVAQRTNGSFEEAYPYESSYAVTALVLFNWVYAFSLYKDYFSPQATNILQSIASKALAFVQYTPETHGIISNHLLTALMAECLAVDILGTPFPTGKIQRFIQLFHKNEGWFPEYDGPDPGYQSLLHHYLVAAHRIRPLPADLAALLPLSLEFISRFSFPEGSFAGAVGSRGTSIFYPSAVFLPRGSSFSRTSLFSWFSSLHADSLSAVSPVVVDEGNFVPVFNSWALFYRLSKDQTAEYETKDPPVSCSILKDGKLFFAATSQARVVVSLRNGAVRRFVLDGENWKDRSVAAIGAFRFTSQTEMKSYTLTDEKLSVELSIRERKESYNTAWISIVVRIVAALAYPFPPLRRLLKKLLLAGVHSWSTSPRYQGTFVLDLKSATLPLLYEFDGKRWALLPTGFHRHMASANTFDPKSLENSQSDDFSPKA